MKKLIKEELKTILVTEILKENYKEYQSLVESSGILDENIKRELVKILLHRDMQQLSEATSFKDLQKKITEPGGEEELKADLKSDKRQDILAALDQARQDPQTATPAARFIRFLGIDPQDVIQAGTKAKIDAEKPSAKKEPEKPAAKKTEKPAAKPSAEKKPKEAPAQKDKPVAKKPSKKAEKKADKPAKKPTEPHRGSAKKAKEREKDAMAGGKGPTVPYIHGRKMSDRAKVERERIGLTMMGGGKDADGNPLPLAGRSKAMRNWSAQRRKAANKKMQRVKEKFQRRAVKFGYPASYWKSFLWATATDIAIKKYGGTKGRDANPLSARPKKPQA